LSDILFNINIHLYPPCEQEKMTYYPPLQRRKFHLKLKEKFFDPLRVIGMSITN